MKYIEKIQVAATVRDVVVKVECDLCKATIRTTYGKADEVEISYRTGIEHSDGGYGTTTSVDICGKCFTDKLLVWLKEQGVQPQVEEWDY